MKVSNSHGSRLPAASSETQGAALSAIRQTGRHYQTIMSKVVLQRGRFHYVLPQAVPPRFKKQADTMQIRHVSERQSASRTGISKMLIE